MAADPKSLVERFYFEAWNEANEGVAREILTEDFSFRGSLGPACEGVDGFIGYMRGIYEGVGNFGCEIEQLIVAGDKAAARMRFSGIHKGSIFGVDPTGKEIAWSGAAFFSFYAGRISGLWVLGDIDDLKRQLGASGVNVFD